MLEIRQFPDIFSYFSCLPGIRIVAVAHLVHRVAATLSSPGSLIRVRSEKLPAHNLQNVPALSSSASGLKMAKELRL